MEEKRLLRILSCGSVDDGKSTLIGRMLHDAGILYEDQLTLLEKERTSEGLPDFSCLLDGLMAEREQGITIDVAYRSFTTETRRYIIADAPGHEQYTRNMVTGASRADVALLLIDAERAVDGLLSQTMRHTIIASLLGIPDVIVAINKMDKVAYAEDVFSQIRDEFQKHAAKLEFRSVLCIPTSALRGDNVVHTSEAMPWYKGPALLKQLETLEPVATDVGAFCMPVQWVAREGDFRGYSGIVVSGAARVGDRLRVMPSGVETTIKRIATFDGDRECAETEQPVCIQLADEVDAGRGNILAALGDVPEQANQMAANIIWLDSTPLVSGRTYIFRHTALECKATVTELTHQIDVTTLTLAPATTLNINAVGKVKISTTQEIPFLPYTKQKDLGGFILVDPVTMKTVGAGMILHSLRRSSNIFHHEFTLTKKMHAAQKGQKPYMVWFTGLSAAGKSTIAGMVAQELFTQGKHVYILDGDNLRYGLNQDLGFTEADRAENIRRASEVGKLMVDAGLIVLAAFISPYRRDRMAIRERFNKDEFLEIFVDTPLEVCAVRDPKGLYAKAKKGELPNFTGITSPFEPPETPDLYLDGRCTAEELANKVVGFLEQCR